MSEAAVPKREQICSMCKPGHALDGTNICESHGKRIAGMESTADKLRTLLTKAKKLTRSVKLKELLDEVAEEVDAVETDAQEWYDRWQSVCEDNNEILKQAEEEEKAADARVTQLDAALTCAVADRQALLARAGMTDAQWSAQGGYCHADVEA